MAEEFEVRLRELEKTSAVMGKSMEAIERTLADIKREISSFLDKAQLALAVEGRVERLEGLVSELFRKADAAFKLIDTHGKEFEHMKAEHEICQGWRKKDQGWWRDRAGRLLDAGLIGMVVWLLAVWKGH